MPTDSTRPTIYLYAIYAGVITKSRNSVHYNLHKYDFSYVLLSVLLESIDPFSVRRGDWNVSWIRLYSLNSLLIYGLACDRPGTVIFQAKLVWKPMPDWMPSTGRRAIILTVYIL